MVIEPTTYAAELKAWFDSKMKAVAAAIPHVADEIASHVADVKSVVDAEIDALAQKAVDVLPKT